ncbi:hypothetical protein ABSA28_01038 [Candidatus Hepatincolaceae symbiont of Richtersius coronifer]
MPNSPKNPSKKDRKHTLQNISHSKFFVLLFFLSFTILFSQKLSADNFNYRLYLQYNIITNISSNLNRTLGSINPITLRETFNVDDLSIDSLKSWLNANLILGYRLSQNSGIEFELTSYDMFFTKLSGSSTTNSQYTAVDTKIDAYMVNYKYDVFYLGNFVFFAKGGIGLAHINQTERNAQSGGSKPNFAYQAGLGGYYILNDYLDIELSYKYFSNLSTLEYISAVGVKQKLSYVESALYTGIRLKL